MVGRGSTVAAKSVFSFLFLLHARTTLGKICESGMTAMRMSEVTHSSS